MNCCQVCKGATPFFFCTDHQCFCHLAQDQRAVKYQTHLGYKDSTANTAINNIMKERKR